MFYFNVKSLSRIFGATWRLRFNDDLVSFIPCREATSKPVARSVNGRW
jgi:hypothetical protein